MKTERVKAYIYIYIPNVITCKKKKKKHLYTFFRGKEEGTAENQLNSSWCWWRLIHQREREDEEECWSLLLLLFCLAGVWFFLYNISLLTSKLSRLIRIDNILIIEGLLFFTKKKKESYIIDKKKKTSVFLSNLSNYNSSWCVV